VSKPHANTALKAKLTLEYDGTPFAGWAAQPGQRTVAGELERALTIVLRQPVRLTVAGRTDRGVHALGQVVSYPGPLPSLRSVNALLPTEVAVLSAEEVPDGFSARYDARSRTYRYRVLARPVPSAFEHRRALWWPHRVDFPALEACGAALAGTHDFTAFTPTDTYHRRFERDVMRAGWRRDGDLLLFEIEADTFMRHMNRILVGTMLEVAGGRRSVADFERLLTGRPREEGGVTAPPHGLFLTSVRY
jgi:tRNA pseudouridine38-40 synthase